MPYKIKKSINIQPKECLPFTTENGVKLESQSFIGGIITSPIQLEIKKENTEVELRKGDHSDSILIKNEDMLNDIADIEENTTKNFEIESVMIKSDVIADLEHVHHPKISFDESILIVRPSLFTLNSQLDYNLRFRDSTKPKATYSKITSPSLQNKDATTFKQTATSQVETTKSYRYAIHNKQVETQMGDYVRQEIPARKVKRTKTKNNHKCPFCVKVYPTKRRLETHVSRHHTPHGPYKCHHCGREFPQKNQIAMHLNTAHSRHKDPYKCYLCLMAFHNAVMYGKHMRTHTTRSFKCDICLKQFSRRWNYTNHMRRHNVQRNDNNL